MKTMRFLFPLQRFPIFMRCCLCLIPTVIIVLIEICLPESALQTPAIYHFPVIILAAWLGGFLPGFLSNLVCAVFTVLYLRPHLLVAPMSDMNGLIRTINLFVTSLLFLLLVAALEAALNEARRAISARDEFFSLATHELKTPITALMLQKEIAKQICKENHDEEMLQIVERTERQLNRLDILITTMMDVSLVDSDQFFIRKETCDLSKVIENSIHYTKTLGHENVKIQHEIQGQIIGKWDALRLEQVLNNLLLNAIKYGDKKPISVRAWQTEDMAWISVQDKGIGIRTEDFERIFQRFERAHHDYAFQGMGLGLYISKKILHLHSAEITVQSSLGEGSTFTVKLPVS